ncbi:hypothetical protein HK102_000363 [Quaeritorhiza haematococci]|nr:hypothetical protein HK102_000363 [Quaeritorhiza haematococci]
MMHNVRLRELNEILGLGVSIYVGGRSRRTKEDILRDMIQALLGQNDGGNSTPSSEDSSENSDSIPIPTENSEEPTPSDEQELAERLMNLDPTDSEAIAGTTMEELREINEGLHLEVAGRELMRLTSGAQASMERLRELNMELELGVSIAIGGRSRRTRYDILRDMQQAYNESKCLLGSWTSFRDYVNEK